MRAYELMYVLDPTLDEDATQALISQIEDFMLKQEVTIENTDPWGKRRLAYQIGRHWEGYYVLSQLKAGPQALSEVERRLRVTDGVLRFLTVRLDKEHAKIERRLKADLDAGPRELPEGSTTGEEPKATGSTIEGAEPPEMPEEPAEEPEEPVHKPEEVPETASEAGSKEEES